MFSAGHTGATVLAAHAVFGMLPGAERPALAVPIPTVAGTSVLLDAGANAECRPLHLVHFAAMGTVFARVALGLPEPRVALLSIGEEETKGNDLTREAHQLLKATRLPFVGNLEAQALFSGNADVVVCDGFTGNVVLKLAESMVGYTTRLMMGRMKETVLASLAGKLGLLLMRGGLREGERRIRKDLDYAEHGGAPLMGVAGTVIISHGKSNELAVMNAVRTALRFQELHTAERTQGLLSTHQGEGLGA